MVWVWSWPLPISGERAASQSSGSIAKTRQLWNGTSHPGVQKKLEGTSLKQFNWRLEECVTDSKHLCLSLAREGNGSACVSFEQPSQLLLTICSLLCVYAFNSGWQKIWLVSFIHWTISDGCTVKSIGSIWLLLYILERSWICVYSNLFVFIHWHIFWNSPW